jgi:hypothetical protein
VKASVVALRKEDLQGPLTRCVDISFEMVHATRRRKLLLGLAWVQTVGGCFRDITELRQASVCSLGFVDYKGLMDVFWLDESSDTLMIASGAS